MKVLCDLSQLPGELPAGLLIEFSDDVSLVDLASLHRAKDPAQCIALVNGLEPQEVLDWARKSGVQHIVQTTRPDYIQDIRGAAAILTRSVDVLRNPEHFFLSESKTFLRLPFHANSQKEATIQKALSLVSCIPGAKNVLEPVQSILDELFTNAIFNAPVSEITGWHRHAHKKRTIDLEVGATAELVIAASDTRLLVYCRDHFGSLEPNEALALLQRCYTQANANVRLEDTQGGAGIGCFMMYDMSVSYYMLVEEGLESVVGCLFYTNQRRRQLAETGKNLHLMHRRPPGATRSA